MSQNERITKLQAAERQLVVATKLYFRDSDLIAIYTLAAASYNIIRGLMKHQGAPDMTMRDSFLGSIPASIGKRMGKWLKSFENFFKHAFPNPDGYIMLEPEITDIMLMDAWAQYEKLTGELPEVGKAFKIWITREDVEADPLVKGLSKKELYEVFREAMRLDK